MVLEDLDEALDLVERLENFRSNEDIDAGLDGGGAMLVAILNSVAIYRHVHSEADGELGEFKPRAQSRIVSSVCATFEFGRTNNHNHEL